MAAEIQKSGARLFKQARFLGTLQYVSFNTKSAQFVYQYIVLWNLDSVRPHEKYIYLSSRLVDLKFPCPIFNWKTGMNMENINPCNFCISKVKIFPLIVYNYMTGIV